MRPNTTDTTSCREYILKEISKNGYIDGNLSLSHGFLPVIPPKDKLPGSFSLWDTLARQIPRWFYTNKTQKILDALPVLPVDHIPDPYLPRTAVVLSLLASAYWRHGVAQFLSVRNNLQQAFLPKGILTPWYKVCHRLQRDPSPYQSAVDLFLNNFRLQPGIHTYELSQLTVENLDILVPSFGNESERVFYMCFVEIHAKTANMVADICDVEDVIKSTLPVEEQIQQVTDILNAIKDQVQLATKALMKIHPFPKSSTYCDPVLWAKTIGIFALPPSNFVQGGTSGTSTPILHVLDALLGRKNYNSIYGEYVKDHGARLLDSKTKGFVSRISNIKLKAWIGSIDPNARGYHTLVDSFNSLVEVYVGQGGFLDKHTGKVFNYLGVATLVGRNQSTSGHERYVKAATWEKVCEDLKIAQLEREKIQDTPAKVPGHKVRNGYSLETTFYTKEEVAKHYKKNDGWIIINQQVYDVTGFIERHPGGTAIISAYLGRDVTKEFFRITAHSHPKIHKLLEKMKIGSLSSQDIDSIFFKYEALIYYLQKVYAILTMQYPKEKENPTLEFLFLLQAHRLFISDQLQTIAGFLGKKVREFPESPLERLAKNSDLTEWQDQEIRLLTDKAIAMLDQDLSLVEQLLDKILDKKEDIEIEFHRLAEKFISECVVL